MIMNKKREVFGVVENVDENKDYTGVKTDTAEVHVDNTTREISVDVDIRPMLGETPDSAYSGYLGAQSRKLLMQNIAALDAEVARAITAEDELAETIADTAWDSEQRARRLDTKISEETARAIAAESSLSDRVDDVHAELSTASDRFDTNISHLEATTSEKITSLEETFSKDILELQTTIQQEIQTSIEQLSRSDEAILSKVDDIDKKFTDADSSITNSIVDLKIHVDTSDASLKLELEKSTNSLKEEIDNLHNSTSNRFVDIDTQINTIEQDYAEKTYVYEKLAEFTKLSKQLADSVDLDNNKVIINGTVQDPVDGFLYLVLQGSAVGPDFYNEYTTIEGQLTLIGDTTVSLEGYVKTDDLPTKLSQFENDTNYAKISDIPDVDSFISEIPEEYITESELENKGFYTLEDINKLLNNIEFIDGGSTASILK